MVWAQKNESNVAFELEDRVEITQHRAPVSARRPEAELTLAAGPRMLGKTLQSQLLRGDGETAKPTETPSPPSVAHGCTLSSLLGSRLGHVTKFQPVEVSEGPFQVEVLPGEPHLCALHLFPPPSSACKTQCGPGAWRSSRREDAWVPE